MTIFTHVHISEVCASASSFSNTKTFKHNTNQQIFLAPDQNLLQQNTTTPSTNFCYKQTDSMFYKSSQQEADKM